MTVRVLRQSEVKTWKLCRRQWNWAWRRGLDQESDEPTTSDLGTIVHKALEGYYGYGNDPVEVVRDQRALSALEQEGLLSKEWDATFTLAEIMVEGYIQWLEEEHGDVGYETLGVEETLEVSFGEILGDEVIVTGKIDHTVLHVATGNIKIRDHKTVDSLTQAGRQLQVDDQLLTYALLKRMKDGTRIAGAEHDMLRRVKRTASAKPPFYGRLEVTFNDTQLRNHHRHLYGTLTEIVRAYQALEIDADYHHDLCPPNPTKDCTWRCPFLDVCPMADDGGDIDGALTQLFVPAGAR